MMSRKSLLLTALLTLGSTALLPVDALAKTEEWREVNGNKFKGEIAELYGPVAIFKTGKFSGRRVILQSLSSEDCVRISTQLAERPALADDWDKSRSLIAQDLRGNIQRVENGKLVPATLAGRKEPRFLVLVCTTNNDGKGWDLLGAAVQAWWKLQAAHAGQVEFLLYGVKHDKEAHRNMATSMQVPFLVTLLDNQRSMNRLANFVPADPAWGVTVLTRDGLPIFQESPEKKDAMEKFFNDFAGFLDLGLEGNPRAWKDRAHYLRATLAAAHANDDCPPTLVSAPRPCASTGSPRSRPA